MTKRLKRILAFLCALALSVSTILGASIMNGAKAADTEPTPVTLEGFDTISIEDFVDDKGNPMPAGEYTGAKTGAHNVFYADGIANLDKKLLSMKVTFEGGAYKHSLIVGGNGGWCGFNIHPNNDGTSLVVDNSWAGDITALTPFELSASVAGVDSFINNEILLQISFAYGEVDANDRADLTMGIYINGVLYNNQHFTIADCNMAATGNALALYREVDGSSIIVKSYAEKKIEPIVLDGFRTVSIEDFSNADGAMPSGRYDGTVGGAHKDYSVVDLENFHKALVSMKVTFTAGTYKTRLDIGGNAGWTGFSVHPNADGSNLEIRNNYGMTSMEAASLPTLAAATAGLTSFLNNEFILQMSFEYDNTDLILGVYINGQLYNNQKFTITGCTMSKMGSHLAFYGEDTNGAVILKSINEEEEPDTPDEPDTPTEFTDVTIKDFVDASGAQMQEKAYGNSNASGTLDAFHLKNNETLDGKMLSMKVTFEGGGGNTRIDVAGSGEWTGFSVYASQTSNYLHIYTNYGFANPAKGFDIDLSQAGLTSILGKEILLQMGIEVDRTANSVKVSVYVDENDCGSYIIENCDLSKFGGYIGLYRQDMDSVITVGSYPEQTTETPDEDLEEVTFGDFGIKNKIYTAVPGDLAVQGELDDKTSLAGTIAGGEIQLDGTGLYQVVFGGKTNTWDGIRLMVTDNHIHTYWYEGSEGTFIKTLTPGVAGVDFVGAKFKLQVSTQVVGNDIKVGFWFNGNLYENSYEIITGKASELGSRFGVYCEKADDTVTIGTPSADDDEDDGDEDDTPKVPNPNLSVYTYADFGLKEKLYKYTGDFAAVGTLKKSDTLANSIVGGDILLTENNGFQIIFGGDDNAWNGLRLIYNDGRFDASWYQGTTGTFLKSLSQDKTDTKFVGEKFNLKVSFEVLDDNGDGKNNDLQIGVWINDVLYDNQYMILNNRADQLKNRFGVYCPTETDTVILGNPSDEDLDDTPKQPNASFEKLTFAHFGVKDEVYPYNGDIVAQGAWDKITSLDKTVVCGDVLFEGTGYFQLLYGGDGNAWNGLRLITSDSAMDVAWYEGNEKIGVKVLMPLVAGVDFVGEKFNLMVSTELVDNDKDGKKNDIKVGIWFNGVLYENEYLYVPDQGNKLGNMFGAYCADEGSKITLNSIPELTPEPEPLKKPNKDFKKITFSHFSAEDGKYKCDGTTAPTFDGKASDSLDRTVLCGDIRIEGIGDTHLMLGGVSNVWYGYRFILLSNGSLALYWIDEDGMYLIETFDPVTAGTPLLDTWFNIMISNEIVDADGDGEKDDIELGVWFNDVLYKNKYLTVLDEAKDFGKCFGFDCATEGTAVSIKSIPELIEGFNYGLYGLTEDWEDTLLKTGMKAGLATGGSKDAGPFSGDFLETGKVFFWAFSAMAALVAGIYLALHEGKINRKNSAVKTKTTKK